MLLCWYSVRLVSILNIGRTQGRNHRVKFREPFNGQLAWSGVVIYAVSNPLHHVSTGVVQAQCATNTGFPSRDVLLHRGHEIHQTSKYPLKSCHCIGIFCLPSHLFGSQSVMLLHFPSKSKACEWAFKNHSLGCNSIKTEHVHEIIQPRQPTLPHSHRSRACPWWCWLEPRAQKKHRWCGPQSRCRLQPTGCHDCCEQFIIRFGSWA